VGEPGDHNFGFSTLNWKAELADPEPVAIVFPVSSYIFTETESDDSEEEWTVMLTDHQRSFKRQTLTHLDRTYPLKCRGRRYEPEEQVRARQSARFPYMAYRRYEKVDWSAFRLGISALSPLEG
jgi:hypothetical protein